MLMIVFWKFHPKKGANTKNSIAQAIPGGKGLQQV